MKITPKTIADFFRLGSLPGDPRGVFLRHEYDKHEPRFRKLAAFYRQHFLSRTRIVTVIGSLGKTSTRQAVALALNCPDRNFSHYNARASVPGNLLRLRRRDRHGVIEVSVGMPGKMEARARMIRPDIVVVTSVKSDHHSIFPTLLDTRQEKVKMLTVMGENGIAILNGDDENVRWMATQTRARVVTFGMNSDNDIRATKIDVNEDGTASFEIQVAGATFHFQSPLVGRHMVYPVLAAVAVAHVEKMDIAAILPKLAHVPPAVSRMEWHKLPNGIRILDDSFKASPESVDAAVETFSKMTGRKIVVMGKIDEPVGKARDRYRELGERLAKFSDFLLCIGGNELTSMRAAAVAAGMDVSTIKVLGSRIDGAHEWLQSILKPGDLVLLKGSINQKLRRILFQLMGKPVACRIKFCGVKVRTCDDCPLLNAPESFYRNSFVSPYIKL